MLGKLNNNRQRVTELDLGKCPLLPGEQGQWCVMGLRLSPTTPSLLLWAFVMCMEGTPLASQRQLLTALGFVVSFRWQPPQSNRIVKPVSYNSRSSICVFLRLTNLLFSSSPLLT